MEGREREGPQVTVEPGPLRALLHHWIAVRFVPGMQQVGGRPDVRSTTLDMNVRLDIGLQLHTLACSEPDTCVLPCRIWSFYFKRYERRIDIRLKT